MTDAAKIAARPVSTYYDRKPIPTRQFDWEAVFDDTDGTPVGYGATRDEALAELSKLAEGR